MHPGDLPLGKIVVPWSVDHRSLGTLGSWMLGGAKKRGRNPGTAKMSMEYSKGGRDICLKIARRQKCVPVDETEAAQQAANEMALKDIDKF